MSKRQNLFTWCKENNKTDLLDQWDYERNNRAGIFIDKVGAFSSKTEAYWICELNHPFTAYVGNRTKRNDGCPYCSNHRLLSGFNDLKKKCPEICLEWDYEANIMDVNTPNEPTEILWGSTKPVHWKCQEGHLSFSSPNRRHVKEDGTFSKCDICSNKRRIKVKTKTRSIKNNLGKTLPKLAAEWVSSEHGYTPYDVSCQSKEMVHWRCKRGHEFDAIVTDRVKGTQGNYSSFGCGECNRSRRTSITEQYVFYYVKQVFSDAINGYNKLGFEIDIYIPSKRIGIEYDGLYYHRDRVSRDNEKDILANENGITLFRFRDIKLQDTISAIRITANDSINGIESGLKQFFNYLGVDCPLIDIVSDADKVCEMFDERTGKSIIYSDIFSQWDFEKNSVNPLYVMSKESHYKVWWICPECHQSFESCPYNRTVRHTKHPNCPNRAKRN